MLFFSVLYDIIGGCTLNKLKMNLQYSEAEGVIEGHTLLVKGQTERPRAPKATTFSDVILEALFLGPFT